MGGMAATFDIDLTFMILGIIGGSIAGLMPGVAMSVLMIVCYPFLIPFEVFQIIQFYISAILISQFVGSVVATYFAIPGEMSSIPAVIEGHKMARQGQATQAIFISALGSFIGGAVALGFLGIIWIYSQNIFKYFTTFTSVIVITIVFIMILIGKCKNNYERFLFPIIGLTLGIIGEHPLDYQATILTFGIEMLESGIPSMPLLVGLYTLPLLYKLHKENQILQVQNKIPYFNWKEIYFDIKYFFVSVAYSIVGFWYAFLPGIGLGLVSNTLYQLQKNLNDKFKFKNPGEYALLAAESSNNSGAFSVMLPLLIFGIPTNPSQAVLYDILVEKSFVFGPYQFSKDFVISLALLIVYTSVIGFILAGPMARMLGMFYSKFEKCLYITLAILIFILTLYMASTTLDFTLSLIILILTGIFGTIFYEYNVLRIIYFYILTPFFMENWLRLGFHLQLL